VQVAHERAQAGGVRRLDPARDAFDEGLADRTVFIARQLRRLGGYVRLFLIKHVEAYRQNIASAMLVRPVASFGQMINA
jgi:hypothetical protein